MLTRNGATFGQRWGRALESRRKQDTSLLPRRRLAGFSNVTYFNRLFRSGVRASAERSKPRRKIREGDLMDVNEAGGSPHAAIGSVDSTPITAAPKRFVFSTDWSVIDQGGVSEVVASGGTGLLRVAEIVQRAGFTNVSHFNRQFRAASAIHPPACARAPCGRPRQTFVSAQARSYAVRRRRPYHA